MKIYETWYRDKSAPWNFGTHFEMCFAAHAEAVAVCHHRRPKIENWRILQLNYLSAFHCDRILWFSFLFDRCLRQCACAHLRFHWHIVKALPHKFEEKRISLLLSSTSTAVRFGTIYFGWKLSNGNNTNCVMGRPNGKREKSGRQIVDFICTESECDTKVHSMLNANIIMGKR